MKRYFIGPDKEQNEEKSHSFSNEDASKPKMDLYEANLQKREKIYRRGAAYNTDDIGDKKLKNFLDSSQMQENEAVNRSARYELLLTETPGFIETNKGEESWNIKQHEIAASADIASANKHFQLILDQFGPYRIDYTRNGRYLLIGGQRGHVAAFDWITKQLMCEMNVMEGTRDVKWLHTENMFAVAQRKWTYIYDNQGIELHCLKDLDDTLRLDFLHYHFLLAATNSRGFLKYLDISRGDTIKEINTKGGRLDAMCHNPYNAIILLGHHNGTVTMWSPNQKESLVKMLCHKTAVRAVAVDRHGTYLATSGQDRRVRIFDLRTYKPLHTYKLSAGPSNLKFSQRGLLAASCHNIVEIYNNPCTEMQEKPYLTHRLTHPAHDLKFCPYEDVLGVGCADGFTSLLVPGSGEPNFDAFESNPHRSKKQRQEWEVKALLEKIQPDMISLDPLQLAKVDHVTAERLQKDKEERLGYKPEKPKFEPRHKLKGKSKSGNVEKRKKIMKNNEQRDKIRVELIEKRKKLKIDQDDLDNNSSKSTPAKKSALSRFERKNPDVIMLSSYHVGSSVCDTSQKIK